MHSGVANNAENKGFMPIPIASVIRGSCGTAG